MKLYEIDQAIESLIDPESGEILDIDCFAELQMEREQKIENMALWVKNLNAEADAIKAEVESLTGRERSARHKAKRLLSYLTSILEGEKFTTSKVAITFRKSSSVEIDDGFVEWAKENNPALLRTKEPEADKTAIKGFIKSGKEVPFARLVENQSVQIK